MSLLDGNDLVEINLYYRYAKTKNGRKLFIMEDKVAEEQLKDEAKKDEVELLETKWSTLSWKDQNDIMKISSTVSNPATGDRQFNFLEYRDAIIKKCLKSWNLTINEKPVPVSIDLIDKLPGVIVAQLYDRYDRYIDYTEAELEN